MSTSPHYKEYLKFPLHLRRLMLCWLLLQFLMPWLRAESSDGEVVRGRNFEGVIFTPKMVQDESDISYFSDQAGLWTPSVKLVLKAEAALPAALAQKTKIPKPIRGLNYPKFYTAKNTANLREPLSSPDTYDSDIENNFLYAVVSYVSEQQRQYIGVTIHGKKLLLMSFIYGPFADWRHTWIWVMDGGDNFWRVLYDPVSGNFSDWNCNGYG